MDSITIINDIKALNENKIHLAAESKAETMYRDMLTWFRSNLGQTVYKEGFFDTVTRYGVATESRSNTQEVLAVMNEFQELCIRNGFVVRYANFQLKSSDYNDLGMSVETEHFLVEIGLNLPD